MVALLARIGARLFANVVVEGLDNVPRKGAVILAINHISNADAFVTGAWITHGPRTRRIHWLGKQELFDWPVFGWLAAHGGVHPVDRDHRRRRGLPARDQDPRGRATCCSIFPEGTRSPDGRAPGGRRTASRCSRCGRTRAIVPIGDQRQRRVWPKGRKLPDPVPATDDHASASATPFRVDDVVPAGADRRAAKTSRPTAIMGRIAALLDPRHRGVVRGRGRRRATLRGVIDET